MEQVDKNNRLKKNKSNDVTSIKSDGDVQNDWLSIGCCWDQRLSYNTPTGYLFLSTANVTYIMCFNTPTNWRTGCFYPIKWQNPLRERWPTILLSYNQILNPSGEWPYEPSKCTWAAGGSVGRRQRWRRDLAWARSQSVVSNVKLSWFVSETWTRARQ